MKVVSLFSGIGAFEKGLKNVGVNYDVVGFSEIDKHAITAYCAVHGVDESLNLGDVSKIKTSQIPDCDLVTYGFPCQDISVAGLGGGIVEGETRSGLLFEALRVIRDKKPKYAIAENVKNLVGKRFKDDFDALLDELDSYGYNNYWEVLNAKDFGIPQNRERVFIVSIRKDADNGDFKFSEPFDSKLRLKDLLDGNVEDKYYVSNEKVENLISKLQEGDIEDNTICAERGRYNSKGEIEQQLEIQRSGNTNTLTTVQKDNLVLEPNELQFVGGIGDRDWAKDGKELSRNFPQGNRVYDSDGIACSQTASGGGLGGVTGLYLEEDPKVAVKEATKKGYDIATVGDSINIAFPNSKTRRGRVGKGVAQTLDTSCNQATIVVDESIKPSVAKNFERDKEDIAKSDKEIYTCECTSGWQDNKVGLKVSPTLRAGNPHTSVLDSKYRIRRLTPIECWKLMGFSSEDYWKARKRLEDTYYNGGDRSNSQMYKMAGNSIVVDVLESFYKNLFSKWLV